MCPLLFIILLLVIYTRILEQKSRPQAACLYSQHGPQRRVQFHDQETQKSEVGKVYATFQAQRLHLDTPQKAADLLRLWQSPGCLSFLAAMPVGFVRKVTDLTHLVTR